MCKINGKKLGELRTKAGVSQKELAREIGVSPQSISHYENGITNPEDINVEKICMILKIKKEDIEIHDVGYSFVDQESKTVHRARLQKGFVRISTPEQTEIWIVNRCKKNNNEVKSEIKSAFKSAFGIGQKRYILIEPTFVHVPEWQRDTDMAKAIEIAENFNEDKFDPIKAYVTPNGMLHIADGLHRIVALIMYNEQMRNQGKAEEQIKALVEILNCDEYNAALTFLGQQSGRKPMTVSDTYRAGIKANVKEYVEFKSLFESENIQITADKERLSNPVGKITPSATALRWVMRDRKMLLKAINLIKRLEWCGSEKNAFVLRNFSTIKKLYSNYGDEVESKLLTNCKGATFYESKVVPIKSNAELYDMLSSEISMQ